MVCFRFYKEIVFENLRLCIQRTVGEKYPEATLDPGTILINFGEVLGELD